MLEPCLPHHSASSRSAPVANPITHYVIVRSDLPRGIQSAMLVHAAGESSPGLLPAGTYAVCLAAKSELELHALAARLERAGVQLVRIFEPDPPYHNQLMALGLKPAPKEDLRRLLSSLPLLR